PPGRAPAYRPGPRRAAAGRPGSAPGSTRTPPARGRRTPRARRAAAEGRTCEPGRSRGEAGVLRSWHVPWSRGFPPHERREDPRQNAVDQVATVLSEPVLADEVLDRGEQPHEDVPHGPRVDGPPRERPEDGQDRRDRAVDDEEDAPGDRDRAAIGDLR